MPPSTRLGRYHIGELIGEGGMAEVFRGEIAGAAGFSKPVAIKRVRPDLAREAAICEAFIQEARVARRMEHGNIVQVYDLGVDDDVPYLVIELVDGLSLAEILAAERSAGRRLAVGDALYVIEHVAAALHYAHRLSDENGRPAPVIHRDVTPRNILISREGVVKLADFGIAKAWNVPSETLPGMIKGTLGYLSPEQASGAPMDARSDQFAAGLVLYELLGGINPLAATANIVEYCQMLERGIPPLVAAEPVDAALVAIVSRAVAVRPADRFADMADFRAELEAWRVARGIRTGPDGLRRTLRAILGLASTEQSKALSQPAAVRLDYALDAQLAARPQRRTQAHAQARSGAGTRPRRLAAGLVAAGLVAGMWLYSRTPAPETTAAPVSPAAPPAQLAVQEARPQPAAQQPAQPMAHDTPAPLPRDQARPAQPAALRPVAAPDRALPAAGPARQRPAGRLKINVIPYAQVLVNGKLLGSTPVDQPLPAGTHTLMLDNPDTGKRQTRTIRVEPGQTLNISSW